MDQSFKKTLDLIGRMGEHNNWITTYRDTSYR